MGINEVRVINVTKLHLLALSKVCRCGKSFMECDCIICSKCGQLYKPKNNRQQSCPRCAVIILEVL